MSAILSIGSHAPYTVVPAVQQTNNGAMPLKFTVIYILSLSNSGRNTLFLALADLLLECLRADCHLDAAAALYGYGSREELEAFHPVLLAESCADLTDRLLAARV